MCSVLPVLGCQSPILCASWSVKFCQSRAPILLCQLLYIWSICVYIILQFRHFPVSSVCSLSVIPLCLLHQVCMFSSWSLSSAASCFILVSSCPLCVWVLLPCLISCCSVHLCSHVFPLPLITCRCIYCQFLSVSLSPLSEIAWFLAPVFPLPSVYLQFRFP